MTLPPEAISAADLLTWTRRIFEALGVTADAAAVTAESLVDADLLGISTHGVVRVPVYVKRIRCGLVNKSPVLRFTSGGAAAERLDGDHGLGQYIGLKAIERACELAQSAGIGMVVATQSNHFGTAGWYARKAAQLDCCALVWSQCESLVVPFGGTQRFFGTNPLCLSIPRPGHDPITLDMATSSVPFGKIELAKVGSGTIPADWAVDSAGRPTTDPHAVSALQPMAGPKGSGLAMLIDLMSGAISGGVCGPRIHRMYDDFENPYDIAHTFIAFRADAFSSGRSTGEVIEEMVSDLSRQTPSAEAGEVLLPGEIEGRKKAQNLEGGIAIAPALRDSFLTLADELGVEYPQ